MVAVAVTDLVTAARILDTSVGGTKNRMGTASSADKDSRTMEKSYGLTHDRYVA